jgi:hypothetical protein
LNGAKLYTFPDQDIVKDEPKILGIILETIEIRCELERARANALTGAFVQRRQVGIDLRR